MSKFWFSVQELVGLDGLPGTAFGVRKKADSEGWESRGCRHKIEAHKHTQRICTAATKEFVFLAYLVAIPRHCFR